MKKNKSDSRILKALAGFAIALLHILQIFFNRNKKIYYRVKIVISVILIIFIISGLIDSDVISPWKSFIGLLAVIALTFVNIAITAGIEVAQEHLALFLGKKTGGYGKYNAGDSSEEGLTVDEIIEMDMMDDEK